MFDLMLPLANLDSIPAGPGATAPAGAVPPAAPVAGHAAPAAGQPVAGQAAPGPVAGQAVIGATTQGSATQAVSGAPAEKPAAPSSPFSGLLGMAPIILMLVALYFFMMRGQKKEEKRRKSLLLEMKKGDKVQTIGGLIARVISIDGDEVVLKVDESNNVKSVYKKSAILNVIVAGDEKVK